VPLSDAAIAVLDQMKSLRDAGDVVFSGGDKIMLRALKRMGRDVTVHGFRSAFKTWASECTGFERDVVEACLTHTISNQLEKAYRRGDFIEKRTRLMSSWADFCNDRAANVDNV
jgi:integrase